MSKTKIVLWFLLALLVLFAIKGLFFGVFLFTVVLKYLVYAALITGLVYLVTRDRYNR